LLEHEVNESHVNELNESNPEEGPEIEDSKIEDLSKKITQFNKEMNKSYSSTTTMA
jgi:hypothetical protein